MGLRATDNLARRRWVFLIILVLVLIQLIFGRHLSLAGTSVGFMRILAAIVAFVFGPAAGCVTGFVGGLLSDFLGAGPFGLEALLGTLTGYLCGRMGVGSFESGWQRPTLIFLGAEVIFDVLKAGIMVLITTNPVVSLGAILFNGVATVLFTSLVALAIFALIAPLFGARRASSRGLRF